ncbi:MAG: peptidogalycan biosysnthesis protein, partial [Novosphingobium sp.]
MQERLVEQSSPIAAVQYLWPNEIERAGHYWGALLDKPFLHFELCYYQAIDAAIALGLKRV